MSVTLRGIFSAVGKALLYVNPLTAPYMWGKKLAQSEIVRDTVQITAENAKKAAKTVAETTNAVLDYPIDQGVKKVVITTSEAIESGAKAVKTGVETGVKVVVEGVESGVEAVDEAQKEVRRDVADWIAPESAQPAPTQPAAPVAPTPAAPAAKEMVTAPKTPAETKAFQEKFNAWLASEEGDRARASGVVALKVDSVYGPLTKYALALYNSR